MARVQIPEGADNQPVVPSGHYAEGVKVVTGEVREVPGENADNEVWLDLGVAIPAKGGMVFAHTQPFGKYHTRLTPNSGSRVEQFVANLGANPRDFEPEDLKGLDVAVDVELRVYKTKGGEEGQRLQINQIGRVE
jgi:hypothetical protein